MKPLWLLSFAISLIFFAWQQALASEPELQMKPKLMWFDASANFRRFSYPDSIDYYLDKVKEIGFTDVVVDVRSTSGKVLFESEFAPTMKERKGFVRPDFDYLGHFITKAHAIGLRVQASVNVFVPFKFFAKGSMPWKGNKGITSMVYTPDKGIVPVWESRYSATVNPLDTTFRNRAINLLKELVTKYPDLDGIILDRVRYGGIMADFSNLSRDQFEKYIGEEITAYPSDIYKWKISADGKYSYVRGRLFKKWLEWRARNIYNFMALARQTLKKANPHISFGTYTGAWYPSYYEVGANWASQQYDASQDFDWATPNYKNYGYAELLDLFTVGNYYTNVTKEEYLANNNLVQNETDSKSSRGIWYCVEGSCEKIRNILKGQSFFGGVQVDKYDDSHKLSRSITMNLQVSDGLMVFDISHIINKNLWKEVKKGFMMAEDKKVLTE